MLKLAMAGAVALALFVAPVSAQECELHDKVFADLSAMEGVRDGTIALVPVPEDRLADFLAELSALAGADFSAATRAFVISGPGGAFVGLEVDGCMLPPLRIYTPIKPGSYA